MPTATALSYGFRGRSDGYRPRAASWSTSPREQQVEIDGFISAIITGIVIGALARLVLPGRQPIGFLLTILIGIVGALLGGAIAAGYTQNFWLVLLVQVIVAAVLAAILSAFLAGRSGGRARTR